MALSIKPIDIVKQGKHQLLTKGKHWERVDLLSVANVQNGYAFKSELFTHSEGIPLIRIRDIENGETENFYSGDFSDEFIVHSGDILIGMDGDFKAAVWQGSNGLLNQRVCRLIPITRNFSKKFLYLCLQPFLNAIHAETSSVTVKHLSSRTIGEIPLPLPPLQEQLRIVAKIEALFSELDKGIESFKTARAQLKIYRQALLKHAFSGKLTEQWRAENADKLESAETLLQHIQTEHERRYQQQLKDWEAGGKPGSKPKAPKTLPPLTAEELAELPELPEKWAKVKIDYILSLDKKPMTTGPFGTALKKSEHRPIGIPVLGIENIGNGVFLHGNKIFVSEEKGKELESFSVEANDIVISRSGTVGEICKVPDSFGKAYISTNLIRVSLNQKVINPDFFVYLFQSGSFVKEQVKNLCKGSSREFLNQTILSSLVFPLPNLEEQYQIVSEIDSRTSMADQLDQTITTALQQAEALRQSILKKAFSGQLVPQDPNDEPASVLLERICAEKANIEQVKAKRTTKSKATA